MRDTIFIDALGTMLWMDAPWNRAPAELTEGVDADRVREAFIAEITYYRAHIADGRDPDSLADLRRRCADVLGRGLGRPVSVEQMMATLHFEPFDDVRPALRRLRERGVQLICVSNWDCSLGEVLARVGLADLLDGVVTSASAGTAKPDPAIFDPALELAGCERTDAIHVGDTAEDVEAAVAAGLPVLRIDRSGGGDIDSLRQISDHLAR